MYSREVAGRVLSFGVSGKLWHGVLVMYDRESGSLWTQLDGRAIRGDERGRRLDHVASVFTTFGQWLGAHPETLVLEKKGRPAKRSAYADYFADPERLFFPHLVDGLGDEIGPKTVVFGVRRNGDALAVPEPVLVEHGVVNTTVGGDPVALLRDERTGEVLAIVRRLGARTLELEPLPGAAPTDRARDRETGETVRPRQLPPLRVDRAFWYAWKRTIAGTRVRAE